MFGSVVAIAFQITFCAEMHANDFFYFLKIIFDISTQNIQTVLNFNKMFFFEFCGNAVSTAFPNTS
jgi:hypothetical protein